MISMFGTPSAEADSSSDCSAIRLRSRQVTCMIGSIPARSAAMLPPRLDSRTVAPWLSVMLTASTQPRKAAAFSVTGAASAPRGGPISAVIANWRDASRCRNETASASTWLGFRPASVRSGPLPALSAMRVILSQRMSPSYGRRLDYQRCMVVVSAEAARHFLGAEAPVCDGKSPQAGQCLENLRGQSRPGRCRLREADRVHGREHGRLDIRHLAYHLDSRTGVAGLGAHLLGVRGLRVAYH